MRPRRSARPSEGLLADRTAATISGEIAIHANAEWPYLGKLAARSTPASSAKAVLIPVYAEMRTALTCLNGWRRVSLPGEAPRNLLGLRAFGERPDAHPVKPACRVRD